jgi:hypothetical protein
MVIASSKGETDMTFTVGEIVTYNDYGTTRRAEIVRVWKSEIIYIRRLDGLLAGGTTWVYPGTITKAA